jgi:methionyl-tRNA formyltransferase
LNIVLVAEEFAGTQLLKALAGKYSVLEVLTSAPGSPRAGSVNLWQVARDMGLKTQPAELVKDVDFARHLRAEKVDLLLNVHSLYIIHGEVLSALRVGAYNLHPGPLPRYAGLNAISWAIYHGEQQHGVTVHKMEPQIDSGAIAYQEMFPIENDDTALSLNFRCTSKGVTLMLKLLEDAVAGKAGIPATPQDLSQRTYFGSGVPHHGWLQWTTPAEDIVNFIRACDYFPFESPWGHPQALWNGNEIGIVKARKTGIPSRATPGSVGEISASGVHVAAQDEWILLTKLKAGGKYVPAAEVLKSGDRLEAPRSRIEPC